MMSKERAALLVDTNFFERLKKIDGDCDLMDLICDAYSATGIADHGQLAMMDYCRGLTAKLSHHDISDEKVAEFIFNYSGQSNLERINRDPVDLKFIVYALDRTGSTFLTCETKLLVLSEEQGIPHACFKAAIHRLHESSGGLFDDAAYRTADMFDSSGDDPFFHYPNPRHCQKCDPGRSCLTQKKPPAPI